MKYKNIFAQSKMNKDMDERLLPKGQYPHAENIRVANSDGSDMGAVENIKGNEVLTSLGLTNAITIGTLADDSSQKIYWFVTSDEKDMVLEYDWEAGQLNTLLQSSNPSGILNFDRNYLITGVNKVINEDSDKDLLYWTDDLNPPRVINISRFSGSALDSFTEDEISVIKRPPVSAPTFTFSSDPESSIDSLEDKFFAFAYRYKSLDGEYSALSSFTNYAYSPNKLDIDLSTLENRGMRNVFNALNITIQSGDNTVKEVQLVVKESNSNTVYIVETFDKVADNISDNTPILYKFINDKTYKALPDDELLRSYDNVPKLAKAQDYVNNRLMYANYTEGFNIADSLGNNIDVDYKPEVVSESLEDVLLPVTLVSGGSAIQINFSDFPLTKDTRLNMYFLLNGVSPNVGATYDESFSFILERDYTDINDFFTSGEFADFVNLTMSTIFNTGYSSTPPDDSVDVENTGFVFSFSGSTATITTPFQVYTVDNTPVDGDISDDDVTYVTHNWIFVNEVNEVSFNLEATSASLKSNRNLEVGIIYMDEYLRKSTVVLSKTNTVDVPQSLSSSKNKLKVVIESPAPAAATKYKFAIKQNKGYYSNIFCPTFFEDGQYVWVKLEESNKDKVKAGDVLYVKRDSTGVLNNPVKVTVLEVASKEENFINNNFFNLSTGELTTSGGSGSAELIEPAGVYMKIRPLGFNMNYNANRFFKKQYFNDTDYTFPYVDVNGYRNATDPFPITQGSIISISIVNKVERTDRIAAASRKYIATTDYASFRDFYITEVGISPIFPDSGTAMAGASFGLADTGTGIRIKGIFDGYGSRRTASIDVNLTIENGNELVVLETIPDNNISEVYYETSETFDIVDGMHLGKEQDQTDSQPAEITLNFFNCFAMGEGVESISYLDSFNKPYLNIDLRPTSTSVERFREVRRFADITYSEPYNENANFNGLSEFNLAKANYKDDLDKKYGFIQRLYAKDTNLIVFQEDKVSKVLYGKDLLMNADGTSNITSIDDVLGQQIPYAGEYGISRQPESFVYNGFYVYFTDVKRGCVLRLSNEGLSEISYYGMTQWFRDEFVNQINERQFGGYDPYYDQYVLTTSKGNTLTFDEKVKGWTSFHKYIPEYTIGMNNLFFSFKGGDLYIHHSDNVARNTFYGLQTPSKISLIVNDNPSDIKELQAVSLEGNYSWNALLSAYVGMSDDFIRSSIDQVEFVRKEGIWYAYARRNEDVNHYDSKSTYGIGEVQSVTAGQIVVNGYSDITTAGDIIIRGNDLSQIGEVLNASTSGGISTIDMSSTAGLSVGDFVVGMKNPRFEGGNLRGYVIRMDLDVQKDNKVELFAVNSEVMKSFS